MRFVQYRYQGADQLGLQEADQIISLSKLLKTPMTDFYTFLDSEFSLDLNGLTKLMATKQIAPIPITEVQILAPIKRPRHDILCAGVNYDAHIKEASASLQDQKLAEKHELVLFGKRALNLLGPNETLNDAFAIDAELDYETELAVIIGKGGKNISAVEALDHVFGYSIFNDFSSRKLQREHIQWLKGKSLDDYAAIGPVIVTKDEFDLASGAQLTTTVNAELRQDANITQMIYSVPQLISELSQGMTLEAGDIIATGTPAGVGMGFVPPQYLKQGDVVVSTIAGLGELKIMIN